MLCIHIPIFPNEDISLTQPAKHSRVTIKLNTQTSLINLKINLDKDWYTYAEDAGDVGAPLKLQFENPNISVSHIKWPPHKSIVSNGLKSNIVSSPANWAIFLDTSKTTTKIAGKLTLNYLVCKDVCVPETVTFDLPNNPLNPQVKGYSLNFNKALIFAFLGGLILNLMPCVFPVLSIKLLSILKTQSYTKKEQLIGSISYSAGVIGCFVFMALVLSTLKLLGFSIGWGFHLQSPTFLWIIASIFLLVSLNLADLLFIPSKILSGVNQFASIFQTNTSSSIVLSNLSTGILATCVATPCTAPLMAPAIAYAFTQPIFKMISIFIFLGLGMSSPFIALSLFPNLHRFLPKPGTWMLTFKKIHDDTDASLIYMGTLDTQQKRFNECDLNLFKR